jgi:hypothetical protein
MTDQTETNVTRAVNAIFADVEDHIDTYLETKNEQEHKWYMEFLEKVLQATQVFANGIARGFSSQAINELRRIIKFTQIFAKWDNPSDFTDVDEFLKTIENTIEELPDTGDELPPDDND